MKIARALDAPAGRQAAVGQTPVPASPASEEGGGTADTRLRVADSILQHGPSTTAELAERLGLTTAAVRRHLSALEDAGHLTSRAQRVYGARERGRPARVFLLTDAGRAEFAQAYDDLAIQALNYLARRVGPGAVADFAEESLSGVAARFEALAAEPDPARRIMTAFNDSGYATTLQPVASGQQLCQHHCPIAHVARAHPEICIAETRTIARLLGTHVQRLATIAQGDEVCTTHIPRPQPLQERTSS